MKMLKMKSFILSLLILTGIAQSSYATDVRVDFTKEKINDALSRASAEGKLVFVDFYATWCMPCKWMDKTTFTNPEVVGALSESFIPIKVNIDDAQGFELKNKYDINVLPTMLILNSKGQLVERIEQTMSPEDLVKVLDVHDHPDNKIKITHSFNTSPKKANSTKAKKDPWKISKEDYYRYVQSESKRNYKVQVGVYDNFDSANAKVKEIKETFIEPVIVLNDYRNGKVLFKVMLGQFDSISEADSFVKILRNEFQISGIVH